MSLDILYRLRAITSGKINGPKQNWNLICNLEWQNNVSKMKSRKEKSAEHR
jgi:hypothetical protein